LLLLVSIGALMMVAPPAVTAQQPAARKLGWAGWSQHSAARCGVPPPGADFRPTPRCDADEPGSRFPAELMRENRGSRNKGRGHRPRRHPDLDSVSAGKIDLFTNAFNSQL
jgi:hypothetical protein